MLLIWKLRDKGLETSFKENNSPPREFKKVRIDISNVSTLMKKANPKL